MYVVKRWILEWDKMSEHVFDTLMIFFTIFLLINWVLNYSKSINKPNSHLRWCIVCDVIRLLFYAWCYFVNSFWNHIYLHAKIFMIIIITIFSIPLLMSKVQQWEIQQKQTRNKQQCKYKSQVSMKRTKNSWIGWAFTACCCCHIPLKSDCYNTNIIR